MVKSAPYQPILLRILHSITAMLVVLALISGFWVYDIYDGRWGSLGLPAVANMQGLHGTIALSFFLVLPFFALYSFRLGDRRLLQPESVEQLKEVGKPVWWVALHRLTNTLMLLAGTLAVLTGRMMQEAWLPSGEMQHPVYYAHLLAWLVMLICVAFHVLMGAKVGGVPLLLSMVNVTLRDGDRPPFWFQKFKKKHSSLLLQILEAIVFAGILFAFIVPVLNLS